MLVIPQTEKLPSDFLEYTEQEGEDRIAYVINGDLSTPFKLRESLIEKVVSVDGDYVTISSHIHGIREDTGETIFNSEKTYVVNINDFTHKDMSGKHFKFAQGVEKRNYEFYHPLIFAEVPLNYQRIENINGLETYVFKAETKENDISHAFPQFDNAKILSDTDSYFWIEPITGNLIKFEKNWKDYIAGSDGDKIVQKGWKRTTDYSIFILSEQTKAKIESIDFYTKIIPTFLISLTVGINLIFILRHNLKQTKDELLQKEKLAVIGNLSARIAHDLRNPLSVIKNELELMRLKNDVGIESRLPRLSRAVDRMSRQIDGVMDFVREKPLKIEQFSSTKLIESALRNISIPERIKIIRPESDAMLTGDFTQLETVLSNILTNSIQAIETTGKIWMKIESEQDYVTITVMDSGPGIHEDALSKIFEPLFTTKQQGTGLGLSSCKTIIENHGGTISVSNNPTRFAISLPQIKQINPAQVPLSN